jgi:hypothetical protein
MALLITNRSEADRFAQAMKKIEEGNHLIEEGHRTVRELSDQMRLQYGERGTRGDRDGDGRYNERYDDYPKGYGERYGERDGYGYGHREGGYGERRDPMGRYM